MAAKFEFNPRIDLKRKCANFRWRQTDGAAFNSPVNVQDHCGLSNEEFLLQFAAPGRVGLVGGTMLIDRVICRAQRHVDEDERWSCWSHAFVMQGERVDGQQWIIESDLDLHRKHIRLGAQENRLSKFFDEKLYTAMAVLDFGLTNEQTRRLVGEGLNLVANRTRYSVRELIGTLAGLRRPETRGGRNALAREKSLFCSALVCHLFRAVGVNLAPGLEVKHTTPEDLARSPALQTMWRMRRAVAQSSMVVMREKLRARRQARRG